LLKIEKQIGTIESGKLADIIAVEGNPPDAIRVLQRVILVIKGGQIRK